MTINRLRVAWGGSPVTGPGLSTFYFSGTMTGKPAAVVTLFNAIAAACPPGLTWTIPSSGDTIDEVTGQLNGGWNATGGALVNASGTGNWAAGVGGRIEWSTSTVFNGRKVRGRTFLVPFTTAQYDTTGTISNTMLNTINTAINTFISTVSPDYKIWGRPSVGHSSVLAQVTAGAVVDFVSTLRSRRV